MACFSCGATFTGDVKQQLAKYKAEFEEKGIKRVYYKTSKKGDIHIAYASNFFNHIHKTLKNGSEFALIQEFGENANTTILGNNKT